MKIHRYFFWIEDNFIEIYKNGNLEKYEGEEKLYIDDFKTFWEKWKKNSKIIASRDAIDFTFFIDKKVNRNDLLKDLDIYKRESEISFSSEDLKKILDFKDFKTIVFIFNEQKKVLTKTKGKYLESEFEENLPEIALFGENIDEDVLNNLANQRVEEKKNKDFSQKYYSKKPQSLNIDEQVSIDILSYIEVDGYIFPEVVEIKDRGTKVADIKISNLKINPILDSKTFTEIPKK